MPASQCERDQAKARDLALRTASSISFSPKSDGQSHGIQGEGRLPATFAKNPTEHGVQIVSDECVAPVPERNNTYSLLRDHLFAVCKRKQYT
jgi:hypothetical protein